MRAIIRGDEVGARADGMQSSHLSLRRIERLPSRSQLVLQLGELLLCTLPLGEHLASRHLASRRLVVLPRRRALETCRQLRSGQLLFSERRGSCQLLTLGGALGVEARELSGVLLPRRRQRRRAG